MATDKVITLDLPIAEVTGYLEGLLLELGDSCKVDNQQTKIMISDLQKAYDNLQENSKQAVISKTVTVQRGSLVDFDDGRKAIVYSIPNDDIVSYSAKILMCNCNVAVFGYSETYEINGDVTVHTDVNKANLDGFIERISAKEKQFDVGILHEAILRFVTGVGANIALTDIVTYKNKSYRVIDIDDITDGLLVIQLSSVRT